ncbi:hypothetical protein [Clostridium sp. FP1]|nr:hypothetical protein [Clostridium sp. FP1]MBZ9637436.1 hypothetical protein [Clostridium sp. FP1]
MTKRSIFLTRIASVMLISYLTLSSAFNGQVYAQNFKLQPKLEIMSVEIPNTLNDFATKNFDTQIQSIYNEANHYGFNKVELN